MRFLPESMSNWTYLSAIQVHFNELQLNLLVLVQVEVHLYTLLYTSLYPSNQLYF